MKIAISVESTNDLGNKLLREYDIKVIPYKIVLGGEVYQDGDLTVQEMFDYVDQHNCLPKTTALNEFEYAEYFKGLLKDYDAVIHICLSSGLTSSCGNAVRAGKNLENVYVIDSKSLSTGIGHLALYSRELANQGLPAEEIYQIVSKRVDKLAVTFVVERLDYLYKGGRCNSLQLLGANIFKIRPRILVTKDGKMISDKKFRGPMASVVAKYCQETLAEFNAPDLKRVFITYTTATPEMVESAREACRAAGFKEILETHAGGTIASHCGANTLGILYFNDGEN